MKYRLTRQSKNFGKVWWSGEIDSPGDGTEFIPELTFDEEQAFEGKVYQMMLIKADLLNHNLGPNSPHWRVEEVA